MLFTLREKEIKQHLTMYENETFVDVGDHKHVMTMYEHRDRNRDRSGSYTFIQSTFDGNSLDEKSFRVALMKMSIGNSMKMV